MKQVMYMEIKHLIDDIVLNDQFRVFQNEKEKALLEIIKIQLEKNLVNENN